MYKLPFPPSQSVWTDEDASDEYFDIILDGGMPRSRRNIINGARKVSVQWELTQERYAELRRFYRMIKLSGEDFLVSIPFEDGLLAWHQARFVARSFRDVGPSVWNGFVVTAQLWVIPKIGDDSYALSIFLMEIVYGSAEEAILAMNHFERLTNVDLANALDDVPGNYQE